MLLNNDKIKYIPIGELLTCPYNREIDPGKVQKIQSEIEKTGEVKPFVVSEVMTDDGKKLMIIDGHHRYEAIKNMGDMKKQVPVIIGGKVTLSRRKDSVELKNCRVIRFNAVAVEGKIHTCKFLEPGLVSYEDMKQGVALLRKEAIDKMLPSFKGAPVFIEHQPLDPQNESHAEKIEQLKVGEITDVYYNSEDGWYYAKFSADTPEAQERIENGESVSCAFVVTESADGGDWHNIPYDEEILDGRFTHMAIVPNPRYEDSVILHNNKLMINSKAAVIMKENSKIIDNGDYNFKSGDKVTDQDTGKEYTVAKQEGERVFLVGETEPVHPSKLIKKNSLEKKPDRINDKETKTMFGLFRKKVKENAAPEEKEKMNAAETFVDIDGQRVSIQELVDIAKAEETMPNADEEALQPLALEDSVDVDGASYKVCDLVEKFRNKKAKVNSDEEAKKKADEEKKNAEADEEAKKKAEAEAKENAKKAAEEAALKAAAEAGADVTKRDLKFFTVLNGLADAGTEIKDMVVNTLSSRIERGKSKYGSAEKK